MFKTMLFQKGMLPSNWNWCKIKKKALLNKGEAGTLNQQLTLFLSFLIPIYIYIYIYIYIAINIIT